MTKPAGKRAKNKEDMDHLNRTALMIGGAAAAVILLAMIASFMT